MISFLRRAAKLSVLLLLCGTALAQQTIEFNSLDKKLGFPALLSGRAQYTDKVSGVFTRPTGVTGNVPAIVIMHGGGGILDEGTGAWAKYFLSLGMATFTVDSFTKRGIAHTVTDAALLTYPASVVDALRALQVVAKQPGIDASRIGVIGFSRGGVAATVSGHENIRAAVMGPGNSLRYNLHFILYGSCSLIGTTTGVPMAFFVGDNDDYVAASTCEKYVEGMRARGAQMELTVFPGARHSYDVVRGDTYVPKGQTWKNCAPRMQDVDTLAYYINGKPVSPEQYGQDFFSCLSHGITVGSNQLAIDGTKEKMRYLLAKYFAM